MDENQDIDLNTFPAGVDVPTTLTASQSSSGNVAATEMIQFPFCLRFAGRPWVNVPVAAPSPEDAATTMDQFVRLVLNPQLAKMGYPANICSASAGAC